MESIVHSTIAAIPPLPSPSLEDKRIILASNSPRRRELLHTILPTFDIAEPRDIEETYPENIAAKDVAPYLSTIKAKAYHDILAPDNLLITADTVVICNDEILGKPGGAEEAEEMLNSLSGHLHTVVTGVTLSSLAGRMSDTFAEYTTVEFAKLSTNEIHQYVSRFKPFDKAGAYGIQEWIGAIGIRRIDGCFYNVMGLPLHTLYRHLSDFFTKNHTPASISF